MPNVYMAYWIASLCPPHPLCQVKSALTASLQGEHVVTDDEGVTVINITNITTL